jgi:dynein heavy chain
VTIKDTIDRENSRPKESKSAQGETEYWRQRSATFNTLYQQLNMPQVKKIINVMQMNNEKPDGYNLDNYNQAYTTFQKQHAQAKDFVKFLNTLYRQFKNIHLGELQTIEETLPSLLTGLKLIWTISRHINQNETKMEDILEAISNEICDKVKAQIDVTKIFKKKPEIAIKIIKQGNSVLEKWKKEYDATKRDIEQQQTVKRWDFTRQKEIFEQSIHMREVLKDLEDACIITQEFYAILGPDLKAVTGDANSIDAETEKVKEQVKKLENIYTDVFAKQHEAQWKSRFSEFKTQIKQIDSHVVQLIEKTFADKLNSSEGAFNLLAKFQNIKTRAAIKDLLNQKYDAVLVRYGKEL